MKQSKGSILDMDNGNLKERADYKTSGNHGKHCRCELGS